MKKTYHWKATMSQEQLIAKLKEAKSTGFTFKTHDDKIEIHKIRHGILPLYPQPFLEINITQSDNTLALNGRIIQRPLFQIVFMSFFLFFAISAWFILQDFQKFLTAVIPAGILLSVPLAFDKIFLSDYFIKETDAILRLLDSICSDSIV